MAQENSIVSGVAGRYATALFERLLSLRSDVGLLSEQYDVTTGCQTGNTPQALSHLALLRAADAIAVARRDLHPKTDS